MKKIKKLLLVLTLFLGTILLFGCSGKENVEVVNPKSFAKVQNEEEINAFSRSAFVAASAKPQSTGGDTAGSTEGAALSLADLLDKNIKFKLKVNAKLNANLGDETNLKIDNAKVNLFLEGGLDLSQNVAFVKGHLNGSSAINFLGINTELGLNTNLQAVINQRGLFVDLGLKTEFNGEKTNDSIAFKDNEVAMPKNMEETLNGAEDLLEEPDLSMIGEYVDPSVVTGFIKDFVNNELGISESVKNKDFITLHKKGEEHLIKIDLKEMLSEFIAENLELEAAPKINKFEFYVIFDENNLIKAVQADVSINTKVEGEGYDVSLNLSAKVNFELTDESINAPQINESNYKAGIEALETSESFEAIQSLKALFELGE